MRSDTVSTLARAHRRFLLIDQGVGPIMLNFALNAGIAWLMFRSAHSVPLWGQQSIAADTLATAFILPVLTSLIVGRVVPYQVSRGSLPPLPSPRAAVSRWVRRSSFQRGAALGAAAVLVAAVPTVLLFMVIGPAELERSSFIWFKAAWAAVLGALVTPLIGWWALARASGHGEGTT